MDIGQLILNFILLTFLGLLIAFSPSLIIVNFLVTLKSDKPIRDTLILIAGVLLPLIIVLMICLLWFQPDANFKIRGSLDKINVPAIIDLLFGLSLLGFAAKRRFTKTAHKTSSAGLSDRAKKIMVSPWSIFSFAFIRSSLSITRLLAVIMIAKLILVNQIGPVMTILAVSWVMALGIAPLLAPPYMSKFKPYFMSNTQAGLDRMMARDTSSLITILAAIAGLGFLLNGLMKVKGG